MTKLFSYLAGITLLFFAASCETDVDLRAPYDDTPIIFGVLDQTIDTQFIKINKSFIGDGDNFEYAAIADCTIFQNVKATVTEVGGANRVFPLKEIYVKNIDDGVFYEDDQKVYYFVTDSELSPLDAESTYDLNISIDEGRKEISSNTALVGDFEVDGFELKEELDLFEYDGSTINSNEEKPLVWQSTEKDQLFTGSLRLYYDEYPKSGSPVLGLYVDVYMGTVGSDAKGEELDLSINGDFFLQTVLFNEHIEDTDINSIEKRIVRSVYYYVSVANPFLKIYKNLNEPVTGIVQERPSYTNINGGIGIFASRFTKVIDKTPRFGSEIRLNEASLEKLFQTGLKFYTDDLRYSQSSNSGGCEDFFWKANSALRCP